MRPPTRNEFDAWLRVEFWLAGALLVFFAVGVAFRVTGAVVGDLVVGNPWTSAVVVVALWLATAVAAAWYVGRVADG